MVMRCRFLLLGFVLLLAAFAPPDQSLPGQITLAVEAGFSGSFRENQWLPVYVQIANDGGDVEGRLVVRPETSSSAVHNTYSLPVSLPAGSRQAVFLYITARSFASQIRVELVNVDNVVVAMESANLRSILDRDQLYVVVSGTPTGIADLTSVHDAGFAGYQANWRVPNIPDTSTALTSINLMLLSNVDTGDLSSLQQQAISDWVSRGGHLVVTGGTNWQATAAGLGNLLPLIPSGSETVVSLAPLAQWTRLNDSNLRQQAVAAVGDLHPEAKVLVRSLEETPLLVRRTVGGGIVDYLAVDPGDQPLRGWSGMSAFWLVVAGTVGTQPSWSYGINSWDTAVTSVNVLPGIDLLPDILPLMGFLALYILLIGPLNYVVLNRINRRELAWVTIPIFIMAFSALAWVVGFNLRGNEVTVSRLTVIESWPDGERAQAQQLLGLLSPRRSQYTLTVPDGTFLRPIQAVSQSSFLRNGIQTNTDIQQTDVFSAVEFPVDASFIAAFNAETMVEKPAFSGQASLIYDEIDGQQIVRGSVRNDTEHVLQDPVVLVRGGAFHLENALQPGSVATFDLTLPGRGNPAPSSMSYAAGVFASVYFRSFSAQNLIGQTIRDVMGKKLFEGRGYFAIANTGSIEQQESYRRQMFLSSFVSDPYDTITGRGDHVYLAGWTNVSPLEMTLEGANWNTLDTTLHLVQLEVDVTLPRSEAVISRDRFTWMIRDRTSLSDIGPVAMAFQPGDEVVFRFTPLPDAVLSEVSELTLILDRTNTVARTVPIWLRNWDTDVWEEIGVTTGDIYTITNPERFLGTANSVEIRVNADAIGSSSRIQDLSIEQRGQF